MTDYVPLSQLRTVAWRGCAGCNGTLLLDETQAATAEAGDRAGAYLLCGRCRKTADAEQAKRPAVRNRQCAHVLHQSGPFSDLYVTEVEGEHVTVGCLGLNGIEEERFDAILEAWWPAGMRVPSRQAGRVFRFLRSELLMKGI